MLLIAGGRIHCIRGSASVDSILPFICIKRGVLNSTYTIEVVSFIQNNCRCILNFIVYMLVILHKGRLVDNGYIMTLISLWYIFLPTFAVSGQEILWSLLPILPVGLFIFFRIILCRFITQVSEILAKSYWSLPCASSIDVLYIKVQSTAISTGLCAGQIWLLMCSCCHGMMTFVRIIEEFVRHILSYYEWMRLPTLQMLYSRLIDTLTFGIYEMNYLISHGWIDPSWHKINNAELWWFRCCYREYFK